MFEAKLQMRLMSGEPKCVNCSMWERNAEGLPFGACKMLRKSLDGVADAIALVGSITTDLTVCSKWEMKDAQQAKVETPAE